MLTVLNLQKNTFVFFEIFEKRVNYWVKVLTKFNKHNFAISFLNYEKRSQRNTW